MFPRSSPARFALPLALALAVGSAAARAGATTDEAPWQGKERTGRFIELAAAVDGTPEELFAEWATSAGANAFFGSAANIEPRVGGLYEIAFGLRPDGEPAGTSGTRILRYEPSRALDFEWQMPWFARELNAPPLPTWVEVRFEPLSETPPRTVVHVTHHGFGRGENWDRCFAFFQRGWFQVLFRLKLQRAHFTW